MQTKHGSRKLTVGLAAVAASVGLWACISPVDEKGSKVPPTCQSVAPELQPQKTDILFVIDNSGSMAEEQQGIAAELPAFIEELKKGTGTGHDFQVGVITTAVYLNAQFVDGGGFFQEYAAQSGRLQSTPAGDRILRWDDPQLIEKFRELVNRGVGGSGQETPFEAVRLAVATDLATTPLAQNGNAGFLRDGARLLVVIVSDEDDCSEMDRPPEVFVGTETSRDYCTEQAASLDPVSSYAEIFKGLKDSTGAPRDVLWASIAPVGRTTKEAQGEVVGGVVRNVDCPTSFQPGHRLREMSSLFDDSLRNLDSICNTSYRDSLLAIAQIANAGQAVDVKNVPDPRLLKVEITRADGSVQSCTLANDGIQFDEATGDRDARIFFTPDCPRRFGDQKLEVKMLCAG